MINYDISKFLINSHRTTRNISVEKFSCKIVVLPNFNKRKLSENKVFLFFLISNRKATRIKFHCLNKQTKKFFFSKSYRKTDLLYSLITIINYIINMHIKKFQFLYALYNA